MPRWRSRRIRGAAALGLGLAGCSAPPDAPRRAETSSASWQAQYRGDPSRRGLSPPDADDARGGATAYFTSGDGRLRAVDAASGAERFTVVTGDAILSSPAVAAGRVVFGSHDGVVRCVDAESGEPRWSFDAGAWVSSSPTLVLGSDLVVIGTNAGEILGLGLAAGELRFRLTVAAPVTSIPVVVGRSLFVNDDSGTVYRFDGE